MNGRIEQCDSLVFMKKQDNCSADIIYCDPPYALGSEIIIRKDGKPDYKKAVDFMNKWEQPDGRFWEEWFKEAFRVLKYGGRVIMFGMDRQLMLNKYYSCNAGFDEQQSLYWYFISNFPKATDLSKMIDRNAGAEREVIGEKEFWGHNAGDGASSFASNKYEATVGIKRIENVTAPSTELAKKYEGYKYSISPLKQTNETIMVFQKPYKTGSCLHDVLAFENGDKECLCGAMNIDGNRVGTETIWKRENEIEAGLGGDYLKGEKSIPREGNAAGRYPAQTFIECICDEVVIKNNDSQPYSYSGKEYQNKETSMFNGDKPQAPSNYNDKGSGQIHTNPNCPCARLDKQNGDIKGGDVKAGTAQGFGDDNTLYGKGHSYREFNAYKDTGGCSKILHKCEFDEEEHDTYFYCPKVSKAERNGGLNGFEEKENPHSTYGIHTDQGLINNGRHPENRNRQMSNNHPTLKPIALNKRILSLFKTPNEQKILYPFAGTFSEVIGGYLAGFTNFEGCELGENWIEIGEARFRYWIEREEEKEDQLNLFTETEAA